MKFCHVRSLLLYKGRWELADCTADPFCVYKDITLAFRHLGSTRNPPIISSSKALIHAHLHLGFTDRHLINTNIPHLENNNRWKEHPITEDSTHGCRHCTALFSRSIHWAPHNGKRAFDHHLLIGDFSWLAFASWPLKPPIPTLTITAYGACASLHCRALSDCEPLKPGREEPISQYPKTLKWWTIKSAIRLFPIFSEAVEHEW